MKSRTFPEELPERLPHGTRWPSKHLPIPNSNISKWKQGGVIEPERMRLGTMVDNATPLQNQSPKTQSTEPEHLVWNHDGPSNISLQEQLDHQNAVEAATALALYVVEYAPTTMAFSNVKFCPSSVLKHTLNKSACNHSV